MEIKGKKVIIIGERDGIQGPSIEICVRSAGGVPEITPAASIESQDGVPDPRRSGSGARHDHEPRHGTPRAAQSLAHDAHRGATRPRRLAGNGWRALAAARHTAERRRTHRPGRARATAGAQSRRRRGGRETGAGVRSSQQAQAGN